MHYRHQPELSSSTLRARFPATLLMNVRSQTASVCLEAATADMMAALIWRLVGWGLCDDTACLLTLTYS